MSHKTPKTFAERLYIFFTGLCMGAADVVPGVSGGTMAFIMGVYEDLLDGIQSFNLLLIKDLLARRFRQAFARVPVQFLALLLGGIVFAFLSLVKVIKYLFEMQQALLFAFFFGLIVASIVLLAKTVPWNARRLLGLVLGTAAGYIIVTLTPHDTPRDPLTLFGCGVIAIMAMILPGISGSFLLLILGQYVWVIGQIDEALGHLKAFEIGPLFQIVFRLMPLALGAVVGLLAFARVLRWVLSRWHWTTVSVLIGFMVGSLRKIWPWKETTNFIIVHDKERILSDKMVLPAVGPELWAAIGLALLGVAIILLIEWVRLRKSVSAKT